MNKSIVILFLFLTQLTQSVVSQVELTAEERAFLFHIVKKSPILNQNIGRYFEYTGPDIRFLNNNINYDSVETMIINNPELLYIRTYEIAKSTKGVLAEAANKTALWELNKVLLAARSSEKDLEKYAYQYGQFEKLLLTLLPEAAMKPSNGEQRVHKKILNILNPSLSFVDKAAMLESYNFLNENDQLNTINAINAAITGYVEVRSLEIFKLLGGQAESYRNVLVAAGDGSETSGLLNEREKDESGRWNKGLPKAVGLFPYQVHLSVPEKRKQTALETNRFASLHFNTVGENKLTQLHFDVWGYNGEKQTTVVVERKGICYHLFGSGETRFLTPDSAFTKGATFQSIINDLEKNKIGKLHENIFGKKGFDYQIEDCKKKRHETEEKIEKSEQNYSAITRQTITTSKKAPRSVKKARKKNKGGPMDVQPKTYSKKKKRGKKQAGIVELYNRYDFYTKKIAELEKDKLSAVLLMTEYQEKLDAYKLQMGYIWATFTEKDGFYTFQDSTTFDARTQEFTFRADTLKEPFEVRLLAIPYSPLSNDADEVMLHVSMIDAVPGFDARLQLQLNDVFASNDWKLEQPLLQKKDSVAVQQLFEALLDKKKPFESVARGQGIGIWNGQQTVRSIDREEWDTYPNGGRETDYFKRLRSSAIGITINREIQLEINTYTDPVGTDLTPKNEAILAGFNRYKLSGNDYLSALRTATIIQKLKAELNVLAGSYLPRDKAKLVIDRLNKQLDGLKVSCGPTSWKWQDLLL